MRSTPSATHDRSLPVPLLEVARLLDEVAADHPGHVLIHLLDVSASELDLGLLPLAASTHPFTVLAGFTAPDEWTAFGARVRGQAAATPTVATFLVDRSGQEASLLRSETSSDEAPGRAEGVIPDLCRRVLGLPTAPPPTPDTGLLWVTIWLDRIMRTWCDPQRRRRLRGGWSALAALHPADVAPDADAAELVRHAREHATAWPWARLRSEPTAAPLADGTLPEGVSAWMDDGFYARWALGAFPSAHDLARDLLPLLEEPVRTQLAGALVELLAPSGSYAARRATP